MREIKFRAWNIPNNTMYYNVENGVLAENKKGQIVIGVSLGTLLKDSGSIIMQYTGLKDKNGKEIYEGDILYNDFNAKGIVKFVNGMFVVYFEYTESVCSKDYDKMTTRLISVNLVTIIIGNIYENKELLNN